MNDDASPDARFLAWGDRIPAAPTPAGCYLECRRWGQLLFVAGHGPCDPALSRGVVGRDLTLDEGARAAESAALHALSSLRAELGTLDAVEGILQLTVYVRAIETFERHPEVADGASRLFEAVFGADRGLPARDAVGVHTLPFGLPVELKLVAAVSAGDRVAGPS